MTQLHQRSSQFALAHHHPSSFAIAPLSSRTLAFLRAARCHQKPDFSQAALETLRLTSVFLFFNVLFGFVLKQGTPTIHQKKQKQWTILYRCPFTNGHLGGIPWYSVQTHPLPCCTVQAASCSTQLRATGRLCYQDANVLLAPRRFNNFGHQPEFQIGMNQVELGQLESGSIEI